jgi:hypothetical protein
MENNSLTEIIKSRRQAGEGVLGSIGGATKEKLKEKLDLRRVLPQGGLLTALFPKLKAYEAKKASSPTERILTNINKDFSLFAKNSRKLKSIANNLSVMKVEVNKLAKTQNVTPAITIDRGDDSLIGEAGTSPTKLQTEKEGFNLFLLLAAVAAIGAAVTLGYDKIKQSFDENITQALKPLTDFGSDLFEEFEHMFDWTHVKFSEIQSLGNDVIDFFKDNLSKLFSMDTLTKIKEIANRVISRFLGGETYDPERERNAGEAEGQQYVRDFAASGMAAQNDPAFRSRSSRTPTRSRNVSPPLAGISAAAAFSIKSESGATTKEEMYAKGGQIVDNDPKPGVKSYGIFGLNSGGSIQNFVKDNPQFNFKSNPPSVQFDEEWRNAAKTRPEELLNAQLSWYEKYILGPIKRELKSLLPAGISVDENLIMFMSDRRNQYGKVQEKQAAEFAADAKNSTEWIQKVTQYDLRNIGSAFSTYLKNNPNNRPGLVNRITNRQSSSLATRNAEPETASIEPDMTPTSPLAVQEQPKQPQLTSMDASTIQNTPRQTAPRNTFVLASNQPQGPQYTDTGREFKEKYVTQILWNNIVNNSGFTG